MVELFMEIKNCDLKGIDSYETSEKLYRDSYYNREHDRLYKKWIEDTEA